MSPRLPGCRIEASCAVNPSEDPGKVAAAVSNVLPGCTARPGDRSVSATSDSLASLEKIRESIQSRQSQAAYRRALERHADGGATWFYLNKQAAFAGKVALCEAAEESPLGPIRVALASSSIGEVIGLLTSPRRLS